MKGGQTLGYCKGKKRLKRGLSRTIIGCIPFRALPLGGEVPNSRTWLEFFRLSVGGRVCLYVNSEKPKRGGLYEGLVRIAW
ncbi:MAG: hypothetical protein HOB52_05360 [Euryarchaeota archaeon]|nr:hypothetical protein [Euryarchaeota archaeon]